MGVMECSKTGCDNILCDRYSSKYGYICYECFDELIGYCCNNGISHEKINQFMNDQEEPEVKLDKGCITELLEKEFHK